MLFCLVPPPPPANPELGFVRPFRFQALISL